MENIEKKCSRHSGKASLEEMVLEKDANELCLAEETEILNMLGDVKGKDILEVGSGIGRYKIASEANHITCIDFKNEETNGRLNNITFLTADVTKQDFQPASFDVVFSNLLLMYLSDNEVEELLRKIIRWTKPEGKVFFNESCFKMVGKDEIVRKNLTIYRSPSIYCDMFQQAKSGNPPMGLEMSFCRNLKCYIELQNNYYQCCWILKVTNHQSYDTFQHYVDKRRYSLNELLFYEKVSGAGFIGSGGKETTKELVTMLNLKPNQKVLDVGSGIGGVAFFIAQKYGVEVLGIDLTVNMVDIAIERSPSGQMVQFQICDVTTVEFDPQSFDVVHSKDTLMHIADKLSVFKKFLKWLKPGGQLLITDYCYGNNQCEKFKAYAARYEFNLHTVEQYGKILEDAGFVNVRAENRSRQFGDILKRERDQAVANKNEFIKEFSEADYNEYVNEWADKIERTEIGIQGWGLFYAETPNEQ